MSETNEQAVSTVSQLPAGVTVTKSGEKSIVTFGSPARTAEVVDLDMGAQFDLAEVTGGIPGDNMEYRNLAYIAASVITLDGVPIPSMQGVTKRLLRNTLTKLGPDGTRAVGAVVAGFAADPARTGSDAAFQAAVGN